MQTISLFRQMGVVRVTRDYWFEIWLDPEGREIQGKELKNWREKFSDLSAARTSNGALPGNPNFADTQHDEILTRSVKTE